MMLLLILLLLLPPLLRLVFATAATLVLLFAAQVDHVAFSPEGKLNDAVDHAYALAEPAPPVLFAASCGLCRVIGLPWCW